MFELNEKIGSVFQNPRSQFFTTDTTAELGFALENYGVDREEIKRRLDLIIDEYSVAYLKDKNLFEISSGERQLIALLTVLIMDPKVVIFDESSANLDYGNSMRLRRQIESLKKGNFDDDLIPSIINNLKKQTIQATESYSNRANMLMAAFTDNLNWKDQVAYVNNLSKLTKADIVAFANKYLGNNYVAIYKEKEEGEARVEVDYLNEKVNLYANPVSASTAKKLKKALGNALVIK